MTTDAYNAIKEFVHTDKDKIELVDVNSLRELGVKVSRIVGLLDKK